MRIDISEPPKKEEKITSETMELCTPYFAKFKGSNTKHIIIRLPEEYVFLSEDGTITYLDRTLNTHIDDNYTELINVAGKCDINILIDWRK